MVRSTNLGFPRIGKNRELKRAVESYWAGEIDEDTLWEAALELQRRHWELQREAGISLIPSNDFSLYDHVLDTAVLVGAIPERFGWTGGPVPLDTYFAMARGRHGEDGGVPPLEMTKWFNTNYHYIVPELSPDQEFRLVGDKPLQAFHEALKIGIKTKPVLVGPVTFLRLSKVRAAGREEAQVRKPQVGGDQAREAETREAEVRADLTREAQYRGAQARETETRGARVRSEQTQGAHNLDGTNLKARIHGAAQGQARAHAPGSARQGEGRLVSAPLELLDRLLPVYEELLRRLAAAGAEWVQLDEPILALDLSDDELAALTRTYQRLVEAAPGLNIMLATYFGPLGPNLKTALSLPVAALHLDLSEGTGDLDQALAQGVPERLSLSLGVVNGRNVWITDLDAALETIKRAQRALGSERVWVAPSCSLLHVPVDLRLETKLDQELKTWVAFATQKLYEVAALTAAANGAADNVRWLFEANARAIASRRTSPRIHRPEVAQRLAAVSEADLRRPSRYHERAAKQQARLRLPVLPTTTIGSLPQTQEVREARAQARAGKISREAYDAKIEGWIRDAIRRQEEIGLDVLVHGEFERNDMVEYFGELLAGCAVTSSGWVQSYGTRCVKPPIIYGDVWRPEPMTVRWATFAQSLTQKPVKGMLTGPVTILQWSFVRDDQPREVTCRQIALALRDEVLDLEAAGVRVIQVDEPALREGLPLRRKDWDTYLRWAVECFRLVTAGVKDGTQIHTHMCYSEFNDIVHAIAELDADVISIEAARSGMELLDAFADFHYPNEIGPGVYDIHSPRVPTVDEIRQLLETALKVFPVQKLWVNPDCGLKTRHWDEVIPALKNIVEATWQLRREVVRNGGWFGAV